MQRALPLKRLLCGGLSCWRCEVSGGLIRHSRNLVRIGDQTYEDANNIRFSVRRGLVYNDMLSGAWFRAFVRIPLGPVHNESIEVKNEQVPAPV